MPNIYIIILCIYFSNFKVIPMPYPARDQQTIEWLWKVSEKWTKPRKIYPEL